MAVISKQDRRINLARETILKGLSDAAKDVIRVVLPGEYCSCVCKAGFLWAKLTPEEQMFVGEANFLKLLRDMESLGVITGGYGKYRLPDPAILELLPQDSDDFNVNYGAIGRKGGAR